MRALTTLAITTTLVACVGCAELSARKVPLRDRLCEQDLAVDGFRYYLPRPYFVVTEQVTVRYHARVGTLGTAKIRHSEMEVVVLEVPTTTGGVDYVTAHGHNITAELEKFTPIRRIDADPAQTPPSDPNLPGAANPADAGTGGSLTNPGTLRPAFGAGRQPVSVQALMDDAANNADTKVADRIRVVMLPDFDTQMAVSDLNKAAKSKYSLSFSQGWALTGVNGTFDSTAVPVKALQVLSHAIGATADVQVEQLKHEADQQDHAKKDFTTAAKGELVRGVLIEHEFVAPGIYKMLKSHEQDSVPACGMLTELGIPTEAKFSMHVLSSES